MKKNYFYGIYGIEMIWHGCWCDPELVWHGKSFNYYHIEAPLYEEYKEDCAGLGKAPNDEDFAVWVKKHAWLAREYLKDLMEDKCFYGC